MDNEGRRESSSCTTASLFISPHKNGMLGLSVNKPGKQGAQNAFRFTRISCVISPDISITTDLHAVRQW